MGIDTDLAFIIDSKDRESLLNELHKRYTVDNESFMKFTHIFDTSFGGIYISSIQAYSSNPDEGNCFIVWVSTPIRHTWSYGDKYFAKDAKKILKVIDFFTSFNCRDWTVMPGYNGGPWDEVSYFSKNYEGEEDKKTLESYRNIKLISLEEKIVDALLYDLTMRQGFKQHWLNCLDEVKEDIRKTWKIICAQTLMESRYIRNSDSKLYYECSNCNIFVDENVIFNNIKCKKCGGFLTRKKVPLNFQMDAQL